MSRKPVAEVTVQWNGQSYGPYPKEHFDAAQEAPCWEQIVPESPTSSSNRHWTLVCGSDLSVTLLAILSVQWDDPDTDDRIVLIPYTGRLFRGPNFLRDVFHPLHAEVAAIAARHGIGLHRAATTTAWRLETRVIVHGPFRGQDGLRRTT